jgi:hypothetical protein
MLNIPLRGEAPIRIHQLPGNCGVMAAWGVLRYFRRRTSAGRLIQDCRYTIKHGVFTIALGVALREHGLKVTFYSDPDPAQKRIEQWCFQRAEQLGITIEPAIELEQVLALVTPQTIPIIIYDTDKATGHFSPISGFADGCVHLPYAESEEHQRMQMLELQCRWTAPEILRQCIVVSRPGNTADKGRNA